MLSLAWKKKILQRDLIYLIFTMKKQEIMMEDKEKMVKKSSKILFLKDYMEKSKVYMVPKKCKKIIFLFLYIM